MNTQPATLQFHKASITSTTFDRDLSFDGGEFSISFELNHTFSAENDTLCLAELIILLREQNETSGTTPFSLRVTMVGEFEFAGEIQEDQREIFMNVSMPSILYPYIRAFISSLTVQAGIQPIVLPLINFASRGTTQTELSANTELTNHLEI